MRTILTAIIMLSMSAVVVDTAQARHYAEVPPGHGTMRAPVGHRQPTQHDVTGADQVPSDQQIGEIDEENARIDRLIRSICRGC